jgi:hypothetical protein
MRRMVDGPRIVSAVRRVEVVLRRMRGAWRGRARNAPWRRRRRARKNVGKRRCLGRGRGVLVRIRQGRRLVAMEGLGRLSVRWSACGCRLRMIMMTMMVFGR